MLRQTEIDHHRLLVTLPDQDVRRLQVPVQQTGPVQRRKPLQQRHRHRQQIPIVNGPTFRFAVLQHFLKRLALLELHDEITRAVGAEEGAASHDALVAGKGDKGPSLVQELAQ